MNSRNAQGRSAYPTPAMRRLRIYAFDPQASIELETAMINDAVVELPWETPWEDPLEPGPVNEYLEVVDYDPACGLLYPPVDLNDPVLLAQNGLPPSEGRPQFHQQMVFAVAMRTIRLFERALGRACMWADMRVPADPEKRARGGFERVRKLRIYPHALREANAYYSPDKVALLFGYFRTASETVRQDEGWVFTCLSQDIVAHETAHAILHGMQRRSVEATNADSLAFHEAFADIVALFQHFSMKSVVEHELARSRGSLRDPGLLNSLAAQFGKATGSEGALRYALQMMSDEAAAKDEPPARLSDVTEPHARGQFLVAAVFDAFVTIYERRSADLLRIAGETTGRGRDLSGDLVRRLAGEACKAADQVLRMCVRALDYVPPVDLEFGEYLRAIITADADLVPDDPFRYRVAVAEAFRKRGICVPGVMSMAPDSLMWDEPDPADLPLFGGPGDLDSLFAALLGTLELNADFSARATKARKRAGASARFNRRDESARIIGHNHVQTWRWLTGQADHAIDLERLLGIKLKREIRYCDANGQEVVSTAPGGIALSSETGEPAVEIHAVRVARRQGPDGQDLPQLVVQITQRRRGYLDPEEQQAADNGTMPHTGERWSRPDFWFRGGATLLVDLRDGRVRRCIRKRIDNDTRLAAQTAYHDRELAPVSLARMAAEPFAFIHGGHDD
jgi:hypothetical protein